MRQLFFAAVVAAFVAGPIQAQTTHKRTEISAEAPSASAHAAPASYRAAALGKGYTARDRHAADCLASVPGYDPATDRVRLRGGASRPCTLKE
jgi:hypothetical protein